MIGEAPRGSKAPYVHSLFEAVAARQSATIGIAPKHAGFRVRIFSRHTYLKSDHLFTLADTFERTIWAALRDASYFLCTHSLGR